MQTEKPTEPSNAAGGTTELNDVLGRAAKECGFDLHWHSDGKLNITMGQLLSVVRIVIEEDRQARQDYDLLHEVARLAWISLDARNTEAKAQMAFENADANFTDNQPEAKAYAAAMVRASMADTALHEALAKVHNRY